MQLYFIRHAQSENNALWARTQSSEGRSPDPGVTDVGHQQAEILAQFLAQSGPGVERDGYDPQNRHGFGLTHLYSSLMRRAIITGTYIAEALDLPLTAWEDIHERGGIFRHEEESGERQGLAGATRAELTDTFPHLVLPETLDEAGWWNRPFESNDQVMVRAQRFIQELLVRHGRSDDRVAIVSHGGFYIDLLAVLLDFPLQNTHLGKPMQVVFTINNVAITRIEVEDYVNLVYLNRVDFLPQELVT
jgi:2,3-bisphosphoglycerate-dependent phosphoglycerate mutase